MNTSCSDLFFDRTKMKAGRKILCSPCQRETFEADATKHCTTCEDPEPLCDVCAQHHTRRKETKQHVISDDVQKLADVAGKAKYVIN